MVVVVVVVVQGQEHLLTQVFTDMRLASHPQQLPEVMVEQETTQEQEP